MLLHTDCHNGVHRRCAAWVGGQALLNTQAWSAVLASSAEAERLVVACRRVSRMTLHMVQKHSSTQLCGSSWYQVEPHLKRRSWKACSRMQAPVSRMKVPPSWHPSSCIVCMVFSRHSALCTQDMQACAAGNPQAALEPKDLFHASKSLCSLIIWYPDTA